MSILHEIEAAIPLLRRHARGMLRDASAADDLVQDCLERAVSRQGSFRAEGTVRAWLYGILVNCHRDHLRRHRDGGHLVEVGAMAAEPAVPAGQEAHVELAEVARALARLPVDQRQALLLLAMDGLSVTEAAQALGLPEGTVMSRVARARSALREMTGHDGGTARKGKGR